MQITNDSLPKINMVGQVHSQSSHSHRLLSMQLTVLQLQIHFESRASKATLHCMREPHLILISTGGGAANEDLLMQSSADDAGRHSIKLNSAFLQVQYSPINSYTLILRLHFCY